MVKLSDCEITHRHIRGCNVLFLFGPGRVSDDEGAALLAEYRDAYGPGASPGYVSADGWQVLAEAAPVDEAPAAAPVAKKTAAKKTAAKKAEA